MTVRIKGLYKKVCKWINELENNYDNYIDVKYQLDNFMKGIFYADRFRKRISTPMIPFQDPKTINFYKYSWCDINTIQTIKPFIPIYKQLSSY